MLSIDGVEAVQVLPKNRGRGTVDIIFSAGGGVPSDQLIETVRDVLNAQREICVDIAVSGPELQTVDVQVQLKVAEEYDFAAVSAAVETAVRRFFTGALLGKNFYLAQLAHCVYHVDGVENYRILQPATDLTISTNVLPVLGKLELIQMEA